MDRPRRAVSAGQSDRSSTWGPEVEGEIGVVSVSPVKEVVVVADVEGVLVDETCEALVLEEDEPDIMFAKLAIPADIPTAEEEEEDEEDEAEGEDFFFVLSFAQSCHELQTLHGLPSGSRMSPGGKFGWVSLVVLCGRP